LREASPEGSWLPTRIPDQTLLEACQSERSLCRSPLVLSVHLRHSSLESVSLLAGSIDSTWDGVSRVTGRGAAARRRPCPSATPPSAQLGVAVCVETQWIIGVSLLVLHPKAQSPRLERRNATSPMRTIQDATGHTRARSARTLPSLAMSRFQGTAKRMRAAIGR
jgi:hypothetical protein